MIIRVDTLELNAVGMLNLPNLSMLSLNLLKDSAGLGDAIVMTAPRRLSSLGLTVAESCDEIKVSSLNNLPRGLTRLDIPLSVEVQALKFLPSHLHPQLRVRSGSKWICHDSTAMPQ